MRFRRADGSTRSLATTASSTPIPAARITFLTAGCECEFCRHVADELPTGFGDPGRQGSWVGEEPTKVLLGQVHGIVIYGPHLGGQLHKVVHVGSCTWPDQHRQIVPSVVSSRKSDYNRPLTPRRPATSRRQRFSPSR
jgi:hypothetical protein